MIPTNFINPIATTYPQKPSVMTRVAVQSITAGQPATTSTTHGPRLGLLSVVAIVAPLLCWYRRRNSGAPWKNSGNGGNPPPIKQFNSAIDTSPSASRSSYTRLPVQPTASIVLMANSENAHGGLRDDHSTISNHDPAHKSYMRNTYQTLPSRQVVLYPSKSTPLPSLFPFSSVAGDSQHPSLPQPSQNSGVQTQEENRRARQAELDNRLRTVQQEMKVGYEA
ncbi:hypothetical protein K443DRAFT_678734 [Laccaria amethystina LaAM-08-1]|uniref:Uncharacterized protein n=1 Tax=Laccaria amethystina LaAM-08-1 TaxID=1095629 RepID=A0A0C9XHN3_9AGAR|nr:hypothetical protein K443DRAFT_678734 [Laccaria amethystina LaAM-08-1]